MRSAFKAMLVGTTVLGSMVTVAAQAQDAPSQTAQPATADASDGEIVVTAEKRASTASRIGMSVVAIGGDDLVRLRVQSAADLVKQVPGFVVTPSQNGTPIYNLRGVGFNTPNLSSTSPVGLYLDQIAYAFPYMGNGAVFDVSRVEVLKGPQGTLYGRNTTGGLINFISNLPTDTYTGSITLEGGNYDTVGSRGFVSGPLSSTLKARFAWQTDYSGKGWQKSLTRDERLGQVSKQAVRGIVAWSPSADFDATLSVNYWHDGSDTQAPQAAYYTPEAAPFGVGASREQPFLLPDGGKNRDADWTPLSYQPSPNTSASRPPYARNSDFVGFAANLEYRLSDTIKLSSLSGYNHLKRDDAQNNDGSAYEQLSARLRGGIDSFSEELRLSSEGRGYNWIVGGYFSHDDIDENQQIYLGDFATINLLRFVAASLNDPRYTPTQIAEGFRVNTQQAHFNNQSISAFANGQLDVTDTIKLTGGVRYTRDRTRFAGCAADAEGNTLPVWNTAVALLAGAYPGYNVLPGQCMTFQTSAPLPQGLYRDTLSENNVSWRGSIDWRPIENVLLYGAVARGYKSGAFPVLAANRASQLFPATQERVTAYEAGAKARLGMARFTLAAYYNSYRNKQVFGAIADPVFSSLARLVNIPKSETYGAEATLDLTPVRGLILRGSGSYLRTRVIRYIGYDQFGHSLNFAGTEFPNSPRWQFSGNMAYQTPVSDTLKVELAMDASYQSRSHGDFQDFTTYTTFAPAFSPNSTVINARLYNIPAYAVANASLTLAKRGDEVRATLWTRNLFDKNYWTSATYGGDTIIRFSGMPRTYGASLTFAFGR